MLIFADGKAKPQGNCGKDHISCVTDTALLEDKAWHLVRVLFAVQLLEEEAGLQGI